MKTRQKSGSRRGAAMNIVKDIRRATRKQYSAEENIRIVLDGLRGQETTTELRRQEGIAAASTNLTLSGMAATSTEGTLISAAKVSLRHDRPTTLAPLGGPEPSSAIASTIPEKPQPNGVPSSLASARLLSPRLNASQMAPAAAVLPQSRDHCHTAQAANFEQKA